MAFPTSELIQARKFQVAQEEASPDLIPTAIGRGMTAGMTSEFETSRKSALEEAAEQRRLYRSSIIEGLKRKKLVKMVGDDEVDATVQEFADAMTRISTKQPIPENYKFVDSETITPTHKQRFGVGHTSVNEETARRVNKQFGISMIKDDTGNYVVPEWTLKPERALSDRETPKERVAREGLKELAVYMLADDPKFKTADRLRLWNEYRAVLGMPPQKLVELPRTRAEKIMFWRQVRTRLESDTQSDSLPDTLGILD